MHMREASAAGEKMQFPERIRSSVKLGFQVLNVDVLQRKCTQCAPAVWRHMNIVHRNVHVQHNIYPAQLATRTLVAS